MLVTILDNSIPFDGQIARVAPLGGPEKSVVALAVSLAARGHTVRVFNRCSKASVSQSVSWNPLSSCEAAHSDWMIAHKDPILFEYVPNAVRTAVWVSGSAGYLDDPKMVSHIKDRKSILCLQTLVQSLTVPLSLQATPAEIIAPAVLDYYRTAQDMLHHSIPKAVVTTHPSNGLNWLLDLWTTRVLPRVPAAQLDIYSSILRRGLKGESVSDKFKPLVQKILGLKDKGVKVSKPLPDQDMAEVYRRSRVHLYPSSENDMLCTTLGDSQAVGLPAVALDKGAARERLLNGRSGFLVSDDQTFADLVIQLLSDTATFNRLSEVARARQRGRTWDNVATDMERVLG